MGCGAGRSAGRDAGCGAGRGAGREYLFGREQGRGALPVGQGEQAGEGRAGRGAGALPARHMLAASLRHQLHVVRAEHFALVAVHRLRFILSPTPDAAFVPVIQLFENGNTKFTVETLVCCLGAYVRVAVACVLVFVSASV